MKEYKQGIVVGAAPMGMEQNKLLGLLKWAGLVPPTEEEKKLAALSDCGGSCKTCISACERKEIVKDIYIAAADGGLQFLMEHQITPHYWVGDMDSLAISNKENLQQMKDLLREIPHEKVPVEKDDTDAFLAVKKVFEEGYRQVLLYGCSGGNRLSHTIANIQLMCWYEKKGCHVKMMGETFQAEILMNHTIKYAKALKGIVSVICLSDIAKNVVIKGLKYEYCGDLTNGRTLGVSNSFIGQDAYIAVEDGMLLLIYESDNV
ncbi:MAG: thiamine diphosphokinase [Lachnospiraceae bacterium]